MVNIIIDKEDYYEYLKWKDKVNTIRTQFEKKLKKEKQLNVKWGYFILGYMVGMVFLCILQLV